MHIKKFIELHNKNKSILTMSSPMFGETISKLMLENTIEYVYLASEDISQLVPVYVTKDSIIIQLNSIGDYLNHYYQNTAIQQVKNVLGLSYLEHKQLVLERHSECAIICVNKQVTIEEVLCNHVVETKSKDSSVSKPKSFANKLYQLLA